VFSSSLHTFRKALPSTKYVKIGLAQQESKTMGAFANALLCGIAVTRKIHTTKIPRGNN
jgi:hypothetical protein